ncbi:uncharacterized protein [Physcomitrium patens]|uniref:uncharacterized protein n=1 Tax=Physcomitrium patens TaxID=3218 RepID=UPI003CCD6539
MGQIRRRSGLSRLRNISQRHPRSHRNCSHPKRTATGLVRRCDEGIEILIQLGEVFHCKSEMILFFCEQRYRCVFVATMNRQRCVEPNASYRLATLRRTIFSSQQLGY